MAFNIADIKGALVYGGARPTLFQVIFTNPVSNFSALKSPFLIRATTIPAMELGTIQVPYFGRKIKVAGDRSFAPWQVTVMNDEDFAIRNDMEQWSHAINNLASNINTVQGGVAGSGGPELYKTNAMINQYAKTGEILRTYAIVGMYPETVSTIDLDWNTNDTIEEFSVTFQYDSFEIVGGTTGLIIDGNSPVSE